MPIFPFNIPDPQQREMPSQSNLASGPRLASRSMWRRHASTNDPAAAPGPRAANRARLFASRPRTGADPPSLRRPPPRSAASSLLKRYRPLETRAAGGFGSVEICLDSRLQRRVAIKRMPLSSPDARTPLETTAAALAEARTASMLQHPNIVQVIDFTYDSAHAYLVMEYVDGMTLEEFLQQVEGHSLTYDEAACIADALVQALSFAHENGVLHLDIKPANVLIDRNGHVKLADFGMAMLASAAGFGGARGGTIGYMPPSSSTASRLTSAATSSPWPRSSTSPFVPRRPSAPAPRRLPRPHHPRSPLPKRPAARYPEAAEQALLDALSPSPYDRMPSVAEFGDAFLARLGNPREGRKSLARIIARLTSDDAEDALDPADGRAERVWELDPDKGYLGSLFPRAREYALGAVTSVAVAAVSWALLGDLQVGGAAVRAITAAGIGVGAGIAPQSGPPSSLPGWLMLIVNSTPLFEVMPLAVLAFCLMAAWWFVWGRLHPAASTVLVTCAALGLAAGDAMILAPASAVIGGFFLTPSVAVAASGAGAAFAQLLVASHLRAGPWARSTPS
ncbi:MAG: serine/threonine-protein kinase [Collinsella sp.]